MPFQCLQKRGRKAEVALSEVLGILRPVDACEVENEVRLFAESVEKRRVRVDVVLENLADLNAGPGAVFAVPDIFQIFAKVSSDEALRAGYENVHSFLQTILFTIPTYD